MAAHAQIMKVVVQIPLCSQLKTLEDKKHASTDDHVSTAFGFTLNNLFYTLVQWFSTGGHVTRSDVVVDSRGKQCLILINYDSKINRLIKGRTFVGNVKVYASNKSLRFCQYVHPQIMIKRQDKSIK